MNRRCTVYLTAILAVLLTTAASSTSLAGKGGKGGGNGGGGEGGTSPVAYRITWLNTLGNATGQVMDMNENGDIVGWVGNGDNRRAYLNTEEGAFDLNVLMNVAALGDGGWTATVASGINELGEITGRVIHNDGTRGVFLYSQLRSPMLEIIALDVPSSTTVALINNLSDVVFDYGDEVGTRSMAVYRNLTDSIEILQSSGGDIDGIEKGINDHGQILGQYSAAPNYPFIYTPQTGDVPILMDPTLYAHAGGFNNSGEFVGQRRTSRNVVEAFRCSGGQLQVLVSTKGPSGGGTSGLGINERGDVCGRVGDEGFYFSDRHGFLKLADLVIGSMEDIDMWQQARYVNAERISTPPDGASIDFGLISGIARVDGAWRPFLLTPEEPPSN